MELQLAEGFQQDGLPEDSPSQSWGPTAGSRRNREATPMAHRLQASLLALTASQVSRLSAAVGAEIHKRGATSIHVLLGTQVWADERV